MPEKVSDKLLVWGLDNIEPGTIRQAERVARLPFVRPHVSLMPDAHVGPGSSVGTVIPTHGAVIPSAVGVDIGCGMAAIRTNLLASDLPDSLEPLLDSIASQVPSGVGQGFHRNSKGFDVGAKWLEANSPDFPVAEVWNQKSVHKIISQFGTLGSGNHFIEVCLGNRFLVVQDEHYNDESQEHEIVWIVLHSGSRGIGNETAQRYIRAAKDLMKRMYIELEDPELAYLPQGTAEFDRYLVELKWSQNYALANRERMLSVVMRALQHHIPHAREIDRINCHHNYTALENHMGNNVFLTRKGAIRAREGDLGIIPGSMGAATYIVRGLGNPASYHSCSHGAGRTMSRSQAKRELSGDSLTEMMGDCAWLAQDVDQLVDEHPKAYKDIDQVMEAQKDLVEPLWVLRQVLNFKGVK
jgi:tRNA-splicing ligase RtcB